MLCASGGCPVMLVSGLLAEGGLSATAALGLLLVVVLFGAGALLLGRRRLGANETPTLATPSSPRGATPAVVKPPRAAPTEWTPIQRVSSALYGWLSECGSQPDLWASFDQLVRELLTEHLGAARVRCYHVRPGCETLQTLSQSGKRPAGAGPSARQDLLGHVVTSGKEFIAGDPSHGSLVDDLATQTEEDWAWVWPVRVEETTIGIVAVANTGMAVHRPVALPDEIRQTVGQIISAYWQHVACLEQLRVVRRTDKASGVLTRDDFFTLAGHALADSYQASEPVVVGVMALEGLRRLDDTGHWRERDALIERVGLAIGRRIRGDDLVGRFADDRFVVLLRRLDSGLGRLIAEKTLATASQCAAELAGVGDQVKLRFGLAGSGLQQRPLEELLVAAFDAVDRARKENAAIVTDLDAGQSGT